MKKIKLLLVSFIAVSSLNAASGETLYCPSQLQCATQFTTSCVIPEGFELHPDSPYNSHFQRTPSVISLSAIRNQYTTGLPTQLQMSCNYAGILIRTVKNSVPSTLPGNTWQYVDAGMRSYYCNSTDGTGSVPDPSTCPIDTID